MTLKEFRSILIFVMEARFQLATLFSDAYVYNLPSLTANDAPDFVENRFFCESARNKPLMRYDFDGFLANDALWDGKECAMSSCCDLNKPPWFISELETDTVDDIELRLCMDQPASDEDVAIKLWEIYVR